MTRLVLVRHGRTAWNAEGRWQGQTDVPLDDTGRAQAAAMAAAVAARYAAATELWSSDLSRAVETAGFVAAATGLTPRTDAGLREIFTGDWEGLTGSEIEARWPDDHRRWLAGQDVARAGGAETRVQVAARTAAALRTITAAAGPGATVLVVGHGASLRAAATLLVDLPMEHVGVLGGLRNCSWLELADAAAETASLAFGRAPGWVIEAWNLSAPALAAPAPIDPPADVPTAVPTGRDDRVGAGSTAG